jgi:hypothetical protein
LTQAARISAESRNDSASSASGAGRVERGHHGRAGHEAEDLARLERDVPDR